MEQAQTNGAANGALQHVAPPVREVRVVQDAVPLLDTARFEHMQRIATAMASMTVLPDALWKGKDEGGNVVALPPNVVQANCFLVVNQAVRWGMDPFAVAQCVSVVHGKLCYEGKLIHAVIETKTGIRLKYDFAGSGRQLKVTVGGQFHDESEPRTIEGTVDQWHKGSQSPWANEADWKRQLRYRGAREWCRAFAPGVLLGVYGDDEMDDLRENRRSVDITPRAAVAPPPPPPQISVKPPAPPAPPVAVRKPDVVDVVPEKAASAQDDVGDGLKPVNGAGNMAAQETGSEQQGRRAPAAPPPPPSRLTGANGGGATSKPGRTFDAKVYMRDLEHNITCCESMIEVDNVWRVHEQVLKQTPPVLTDGQVNAALGFYHDAQQIFGG